MQVNGISIVFPKINWLFSGFPQSRRSLLLACAILIIIMSTLRLVMEFVELLRVREKYFISFVNWVEVLLYVLALNFVWVFRTDCFCIQEGMWNGGVFSVLLSWVSLILNMDKFPFTGIYVIMFLTIYRTFMKTIIFSVLLIVAFGIAFFLTFNIPSNSAPENRVSLSKLLLQAKLILNL